MSQTKTKQCEKCHVEMNFFRIFDETEEWECPECGYNTITGEFRK